MTGKRWENAARRRNCLKTLGLGLLGLALTTATAVAQLGEPEKEDLKFGFIKLTDMAPLAIAYEKGYFEDEGLYVTLEAQANWKVLLDGVIDGQLGVLRACPHYRQYAREHRDRGVPPHTSTISQCSSIGNRQTVERRHDPCYVRWRVDANLFDPGRVGRCFFGFR